MAIPVGQNQGFSRTLVSQGTHVATFVRMIDVGTQETEWQGAKKKERKVKFMLEIPEEMVEFNGEQVPATIWTDFNMTMGSSNKPSNLRKFLESARGRVYTQQEVENVDITKVLGHSIQIQIVHKTSANGKTYDNIQAAMALPKGFPKPSIHHKVIEFSFHELQNGKREEMLKIYEELPQFVKDTIVKSDEWKALFPNGNAQQPQASTQSPQGERAIDPATLRQMQPQEIVNLVGGDLFARKADNVKLEIVKNANYQMTFKLLGKEHTISHDDFAKKILTAYNYAQPVEDFGGGDDFSNGQAPDDDLPF